MSLSYYTGSDYESHPVSRRSASSIHNSIRSRSPPVNYYSYNPGPHRSDTFHPSSYSGSSLWVDPDVEDWKTIDSSIQIDPRMAPSVFAGLRQRQRGQHRRRRKGAYHRDGLRSRHSRRSAFHSDYPTNHSSQQQSLLPSSFDFTPTYSIPSQISRLPSYDSTNHLNRRRHYRRNRGRIRDGNHLSHSASAISEVSASLIFDHQSRLLSEVTFVQAMLQNYIRTQTSPYLMYLFRQLKREQARRQRGIYANRKEARSDQVSSLSFLLGSISNL